MKLVEKYTELVMELGRAKVDFQGLSARLGSAAAAQREIDAIGVMLIDLEERSGIAEAKRIREHEKTSMPELPTFQQIAKDSTPRPDDAQKLASGAITQEKLAQRAELLRGAREALGRIGRMVDDVAARRKNLSKEAIALANEVDPLSSYERTNFTRLHADTRASRAGNEHLGEILAPLPV